MQSNVYFLLDNKVTVEIMDGETTIFSITGPREAVELSMQVALYKAQTLIEHFPEKVAEIMEKAEAFKAALAKILYTPISWD